MKGVWQPGDEGVCRVNAERPRPGSEEPGLLALAPGTVYGQASALVAATRLQEEAPPKTQGSQMTAGIAFGVRRPDDFYLVETSALHDFVRLDGFVHGRRRDLREVRVRTHQGECHELAVHVQGDRVGVAIDGRPLFEQTAVPETAGGLGLWARVSEAACFSDASVALQ